MTARGRWLRAGLIGLLVALVGGRWVAAIAADNLWASAVGVASVQGQIRTLRGSLEAVAFIVAALWCGGNLYLVYRSIGAVHVPRRLGNLEIVEAVPRRYLLVGAIGVGLLLAYALSHGAADWWTVRALAGAGVPLGMHDPILGRDLGYYLFRLPWLRAVHAFVLLLTGVVLLIAGFLYLAVGVVRWRERHVEVHALARTHLALLLSAFALALFWGYRLEPLEYVAGIHHVPFDRVMTDIRIPFARFLAAVALATALGSLVWIRVPRAAIVLLVWTVLATTSFVGHYIAPTFAAAANGVNGRTTPALDSAAAAFRRVAFGLPPDTRYAPPSHPGPEFVARHRAALELAPLWDGRLATRAMNRRATLRPYDRIFTTYLTAPMTANGPPIYLGVAEVDLQAARQADQAMTWERVHHHPYASAHGVFALDAARTGADGAPRFLSAVGGAAAFASDSVPLVDSAALWFGPHVADFAVADPVDGTFDGVEAGGMLRRIVLAWALQSPHLLSRRDVHPDTRILWDRTVAPRLERYAPFAQFGTPYPVLADGRLLWVAPGCVWTEGTPLVNQVSWDGRRVGYLRCAFVGVVDAQSGQTDVYASRDADPVSAAWLRLLPQLVRSDSSLPPTVRNHLRYPERLLRAQVEELRSADPRLRDTASVRRIPDVYWWFGTAPGDTMPRIRARVAIEGPGPVRGQTDLAAIVDATVRGGDPRVTVFVLDDPHALPGPSTLGGVLEEPSASGDAGVPGTLRLAPFDDGVLAVQSRYRTDGDSTGQGPRLIDVALGWRGALGRGATLADALANMQSAPVMERGSAALAEARRLYTTMDSARRAGDWERFGTAYDALGRLLGGTADSLP